MNFNWSDAENALDILDHVWIGLVLIAVTGIPSYLTARTHKSVKTETRVIRDQLVNGHKTYLREDLDKALAAIDGLAHEVRGLRTDLLSEQDSRRAQVAELRDDIEHRMPRKR